MKLKIVLPNFLKNDKQNTWNLLKHFLSSDVSSGQSILPLHLRSMDIQLP